MYEISRSWWPDRCGEDAAGRTRREKVRLTAAAMFEQDMQPVQVADELRVSTKSAYQWRRRWRAGGIVALASKGAGGAVCRLGPGQLSRLRAALDQGPAAWGWAEDQRWTLERVTTLIRRLFHVRYTLRGTSYLLHRMGFTPQVPVHRAAERDEAAIAAWRDMARVKLRGCGGDRRVYLLQGRGRAGHAPAEGPHLGPPRLHPGGRGVREGLRAGVRSGTDLLQARRPQPLLLPDPRACRAQGRAPQHVRGRLRRPAHRRAPALHAPLILVWDNLNTHISAAMRALLQPHQDWLTIVRLPAYSPDLNPVEGAWSNMKSSLGNLGSCSTVRQLAAIMKNRLKRIQYRPGLIDGFLAQTGPSLEPEPP